jgi:calcium-dependent protein kinase
LLKGYLKIYDEKTAEACVQNIFDKLDTDGSGTIDPDEWLTATINKENLLSLENIEKAFKLIDQDDGGTISLDEI